MATPSTPTDETLRRVEEFLAAYKADLLRALQAAGKRSVWVRAAAHVEGGQVAQDSYLEGPHRYPFNGRG